MIFSDKLGDKYLQNLYLFRSFPVKHGNISFPVKHGNLSFPELNHISLINMSWYFRRINRIFPDNLSFLRHYMGKMNVED